MEESTLKRQYQSKAEAFPMANASALIDAAAFARLLGKTIDDEAIQAFYRGALDGAISRELARRE
jgi:hypothetical protein